MKKRKYMGKNHPLLWFVEWDDHACTRGWNPIDSDDTGPVTVGSVGFVLQETDDYIVLASHISDAGNMSDGMSILKKCITHSKRLKNPANWDVEEIDESSSSL